MVLAAPLASSDGRRPRTRSTIAGARSLSDQVVVDFGGKPAQERTTDVHLLAFNDLHGNLEAAGQQHLRRSSPAAPPTSPRPSRTARPLYGDHQATVLAGDNIGASPLANGLFFEEPITIASNLMNVDFASVGNHEFDKGSAELLRIQNGGCHPSTAAPRRPYALPDGSTTNVYPGADFQYLSANVVVDATGKTLLPAFGTKRFKSDSGKEVHGRVHRRGPGGDARRSSRPPASPA